MDSKDIIDILAANVEHDRLYFYSNRDCDYWHYGWRDIHERVTKVAELAAQNFPGDIAEIGCAQGIATARFAEIAKRHGRRVIAIDPWEREPSDYEDFVHSIREYMDIVDIVRAESQSPEAVLYLGKRRLCFAYIDGLHTYEACLSDLRAVSHARIIAVDDVLWDWPLLRAFHEGSSDRHRIRHPFCREAYIL